VFLSHGIRERVRVHLVVADEFTVTTFDADSLRHLHPDERNVAARIRDALDAQDDAIGHMPADVSPGVELRRMGLEATLDRVLDTPVPSSASADPTLASFTRTAIPVDAAPPTDPVFVLSDHNDFAPAERDLLADRAERRVRVGPELLHADHTVSVVHNWLDTDGYESLTTGARRPRPRLTTGSRSRSGASPSTPRRAVPTGTTPSTWSRSGRLL